MFLCKDCKKKYRIKPNYCDCGNYTFDEINRIPDWSVFFLIACIILSFVILLFPVKIDSSKTVEKNKPEAALPKTKIPDINTFWNDTPAIAHKKTLEPKTQTVVKPTAQQPAPAKKTSNSSKTETKKIKKQQQTLTKTKVPAKPIQKVKTQPQQKPKTNAPAKTNTKAKAVQQPKPKPKVQPTQKSKAPAPKQQVTSAKDSEEFYRYKLGLRQTLFANLAILSIQGKGKCGIEFYIDKNGKLTNRAFTFQSDNNSVNDEVYKMLMKMPKYYAPPKAYKGEKIKLTFEFNNGSYTINYTN